MNFTFDAISVQPNEKTITDLWRIHINSTVNRFDWLYRQNPAGPMHTVVARHRGEAVGCGSVYPREISIRGERKKIGIATDFIVKDEYRVFGPALGIQKKLSALREAEEFEFLFAFPNKSSRGVFLRAGYHVLGNPRRLVKVLKTGDKLNAKMAKYKQFFRRLSSALDRLLAMADVIRGPHGDRYEFKLHKRPWNLSGQPLSTHSSHIRSEKSTEYLNWRYHHASGNEYQLFSFCDTLSHQTRGFIVFQINNGIATIEDMSFNNFKSLHFMICAFSKYLRQLKVKSISILFLGDTRLIDVLKRNFFFERPTSRTCLIFFKDPYLQEKKDMITKIGNWELFESEMDL